MQDYLFIGGKTILFYIILILVMRLMGKREVGELSIFDVVVYFVISELLSISIATPEENPLKIILAITVILILQAITAWLALKYEKFRKLVEGTPTIIIKSGRLDQEAMRSQRYTVDDLMAQLHEKDIQSPTEVEFAILENSGTLSIIPKDNRKVKWPNPFIKDGLIDETELKQSGHGKEWLLKEIQANGYANEKDLFLALWLEEGWFLVRKQNPKNGSSV